MDWYEKLISMQLTHYIHFYCNLLCKKLVKLIFYFVNTALWIRLKTSIIFFVNKFNSKTVFNKIKAEPRIKLLLKGMQRFIMAEVSLLFADFRTSFIARKIYQANMEFTSTRKLKLSHYHTIMNIFLLKEKTII